MSQKQQPAEEDPDPVITYCYRDGRREQMRRSEAYAKIDSSKLDQICKKCKHSLDDHAAVTNYVDRPAGRCMMRGCKCKQYRIGPLITQKESLAIHKQADLKT